MERLLLMEKLVDMSLPVHVRVDLCELYTHRYMSLPSDDFDLRVASLPTLQRMATELDYVIELYQQRVACGMGVSR